jgi:hypothetical protein
MPSLPFSASLVLMGALFLGLTACNRAPAPLASGKVVSVELGERPVLRGGETGTWNAKTFHEGTVEIYPTCIIVTEPNGTKHLAPPERFGTVRFK